MQLSVEQELGIPVCVLCLQTGRREGQGAPVAAQLFIMGQKSKVSRHNFTAKSSQANVCEAMGGKRGLRKLI